MSGDWHTIESDAGVFTYLVENLGVQNVHFEELVSLDADTLAQLHPVYGIIFLFRFPTEMPYIPATDKPIDGAFDHDAAQDLFFARQTIQNACGTQALLSILLNKATPDDTPASSSTASPASDLPLIDTGPALRDFRAFTMPLPPEFRGEALGNAELIRTVHNTFARSSPFVDETRRAPDDDAGDAFHFIAYTPLNGQLYELDGLQPAPITHGPCAQADFPARVIEVLQRRIARYDEAEIRFNLLAVVRDLRLRARDLGDVEMLEREERRRQVWKFENALRAHNFLGFTGEVLRGVVGMKMREGSQGDGSAYAAWIKDAKSKMRKRVEDNRKRKDGWGDGDVEMG